MSPDTLRVPVLEGLEPSLELLDVAAGASCNRGADNLEVAGSGSGTSFQCHSTIRHQMRAWELVESVVAAESVTKVMFTVNTHELKQRMVQRGHTESHEEIGCHQVVSHGGKALEVLGLGAWNGTEREARVGSDHCCAFAGQRIDHAPPGETGVDRALGNVPLGMEGIEAVLSSTFGPGMESELVDVCACQKTVVEDEAQNGPIPRLEDEGWRTGFVG